VITLSALAIAKEGIKNERYQLVWQSFTVFSALKKLNKKEQ